MTDFTHLNTISQRLLRETERYAAAKTVGERVFREAQMRAATKELDTEYRFLGIEAAPLNTMTDEELLAELGV